MRIAKAKQDGHTTIYLKLKECLRCQAESNSEMKGFHLYCKFEKTDSVPKRMCVWEVSKLGAFY